MSDILENINYYIITEDIPFIREYKYQDSITEYFFKDTIVKSYTDNSDEYGFIYVKLIKLPKDKDFYLSAKEEFVNDKFLTKLDSIYYNTALLIDVIQHIDFFEIKGIVDEIYRDR